MSTLIWLDETTSDLQKRARSQFETKAFGW